MIDEVIFTPEVRRKAELLVTASLCGDERLRSPKPNAAVEGAPHTEPMSWFLGRWVGLRHNYRIVLEPMTPAGSGDLREEADRVNAHFEDMSNMTKTGHYWSEI